MNPVMWKPMHINISAMVSVSRQHRACLALLSPQTWFCFCFFVGCRCRQGLRVLPQDISIQLRLFPKGRGALPVSSEDETGRWLPRLWRKEWSWVLWIDPVPKAFTCSPFKTPHLVAESQGRRSSTSDRAEIHVEPTPAQVLGVMILSI